MNLLSRIWQGFRTFVTGDGNIGLVASITVLLTLIAVFAYSELPRINDNPPEPTPTTVVLPTPTELLATIIPTQEPIPTTATRIRFELPTIVIDQMGEYIATYYDQCCVGGPYYCGTNIYGYFDPSDPTTVATSFDGFACGTKLLLCADERCLIVVIKDKCGGCGSRHLDLSRGAWELLGMPSSVKVSIVEE